MAEKEGELLPENVMDIFVKEYIDKDGLIELISIKIDEEQEGESITLIIRDKGIRKSIQGFGLGPLDALRNALVCNKIINFDILDYSQHTLGKDSKARSVAYIQIETQDEKYICGAGIDKNIIYASHKAIFSCINRYLCSN